MSAFTEPLTFASTDSFREGRRLYKTTRTLTYFVDTQASLRIDVPAGTLTDLASIPAWARSVFAPDGPWAAAAVVHDHLYERGLVSRPIADRIFYEALLVLGAPRWRAWLMWLGVRLGGRRGYRPHKGARST